MSDDEKEPICVSCTIERASFEVLHEFTDVYPDVKMSYDEWMGLRWTVESVLKAAFGILESSEEETSDEKPTMQ